MIKHQRHVRILSLLRREGSVDAEALARLMPEVSRVTLRRDVAELAEAGALRRTHGGAVLPDADLVAAGGVTPLVPKAAPEDLDRADAVILPPVSDRGGAALRRRIAGRGLPFLAESAHQPGGAYLGPENRAAGEAVGRHAARDARGAGDLSVLMVCQPELANTRDRAEGFEAALRARHDGAVATVQVNGQGAYRTALRVARDALRANPGLAHAFAVNDHSAQAVIEAAAREGRRIALYAVGGESPDFVGRLAEDGPLRAVACLFPEAVGRIGIDRVALALAGGVPEPAPTPHVVLTAADVGGHYVRGARGWSLREDRLEALAGRPLNLDLKGRRVAFMPHYPAHDWYRAMIAAMRERAALYRLTLDVVQPHHGIIAERTRLRRRIAQAAAEGLRPGETVVIGQGEAGVLLAGEIRRMAFDDAGALRGLTVITNALDVLDRLAGAPGLRCVLTSGELQPEDRCLVGPSLGALFERMRADAAYLCADGATAEFGPSSGCERLALAGSRCAAASRRTVILADHLSVGQDATHRILRADAVHRLITDDGTPAGLRQAFRAAGIDVLVAGDEDAPARAPHEPRTTQQPREERP